MDRPVEYRRFWAAPLALALMLLAAAAQAQESTDREMELVAPFSACGSITRDVERLACFDAALAQLPGAQARAAVREEGQIIAEFGLPTREQEVPSPGEAERIEATSALVGEGDQIGVSSKVAEVFTAVGQRSVILLENGQLWREGSNSTRSVSPRPGAIATITPSPFGGGYRMRFDGRSGFLSVIRIR